jgi:integrative and conjugative element protein (TIGR02256 family)
MIRVPIGTSGQTVVFSSRVLKHLDKARQIKAAQPEAGGQLFAKLREGEIRIERATGPRLSDSRARTRYMPDRRAEQEEIARMHNDGFHYVGDWHTHPDAYPSPSAVDIDSIRECVLRSRHELNGFLMVVVGTGPVPQALHISTHDGRTFTVLKASDRVDPEPKGSLPKRVLTKLFKKSTRTRD